MPFDEQIAQDLIKKYDLSAHVFNSWKSRGAIPNKYFNPDYELPHALTPARKKEEQCLLRVLASPSLNTNEFSRQVGITKSTLETAARKDKKQVDLRLTVMLKLKSNLQELRSKIEAVVGPLTGQEYFTDPQKEELDKLLLDTRLVRRSILGNGRGYDRHIQRHSPTSSTEIFEDWEAVNMVDRLNVLLLDTVL